MEKIFTKDSKSMLLPEERADLEKERREIAEEANKLLIDQQNQLTKIASIDELTQLNNRRSLEQKIEEVFLEMQLERTSGVYFVLFDIDHFKRVNDSFGHLAGDKILRSVAEVIGDCTRETDFSGRWGGEEFLLVLTDMSGMAGAIAKAEQIRKKVEVLTFDEYPSLKVTISAGVAQADNTKAPAEVLGAADQALYHSKRNNRNQVTAYSESLMAQPH